MVPVILRQVAADRLIRGLWRKWLLHCFLKNYFVRVGAGCQSADVQVQRMCRTRDKTGVTYEWKKLGWASALQCSYPSPFPLQGVRFPSVKWGHETQWPLAGEDTYSASLWFVFSPSYQSSSSVKQESWVRLSAFKSRLCYFLAVWPKANYLTSLCLSVFICNMCKIVVLTT